MKYLIICADENHMFTDAENIEDCIIQFADYTGANSDLFLKALKGCHTPKDYVDMYNHFGGYMINSIFTIQQTIYDWEAEEK